MAKDAHTDGNGSAKVADLIRSRLMNGEELNPTQIGAEYTTSSSYLQVVIRDMERQGTRFTRRREMVNGKKLVFYSIVQKGDKGYSTKPMPKSAQQRKAAQTARQRRLAAEEQPQPKAVKVTRTASKQRKFPELGAWLRVTGHMLGDDEQVNIVVQSESGQQTWIVNVLNSANW